MIANRNRGRARSFHAATWLVLAAGLLWGPGAGAHRIQYPKRDYLEFSPGRVTWSFNLDVEGGEEASRLRGRFDQNGDGALDQGEADLLQQFLAREGQKSAALSVNGQAPALQITSISGHGTDLPLSSRDHMGVFVVMEGPLPAGESIEVSFSDRTEEGMRRVPLQVTLKGFQPEGAASAKAENNISGGTALKGITLDAGRTWTATLTRTPTPPSPP